MRISIPTVLLALTLSSPALAESDATTPPPSVFQDGFNSSAADQVTFDDSQGAATTIYVNREQQINGGGCHFFWVAAGVKIPGGTSAVFSQVGYSICNTTDSPAIPFLYTSGSNVPNGNQYNYYPQHALEDHAYYTFAFSTNGVRQSNGSYKYQYVAQEIGGSPVVLDTIELDSGETYAPYALSEVSGSSNACDDTFDVAYGGDEGHALAALKNGRWQPIAHVEANYWYGPCSSSNVEPLGFQDARTLLGPKVVQTTPVNSQVW